MTASFFVALLAAAENPAARGRRRGAKRPEKQGRRLCLRPLLFCLAGPGALGPPGPQTPPPPRAVAVFCRPNESSATPFLPRLPTNKTSPPLPMSGGPAYFAGKPKKFSSWFSPAFFKSGRGGGAERRQWRKKRGGSPVSKGVEGSRFSGDAQRPLRTVWGRSPQRGPGAEPLAGSGASPRRKPRKLPPVTPAQAGTGPGGGGRGSPLGDRRRCPGF